MTYLPEFLSWENLATLSNSAFTTSLVGALAGAYAGAKAAQKIAERAKERSEYQVQIRNTNAAITLAFIICNAAISLKRQQTKDLCDMYFEKKAALEEFSRKRKFGEISRETLFEFQADLRSVPFPAVPIDALRSLVYEKLSVSGRPLALVATLAGVLSSLADLISNRNGLIASFKQISPQARETILPALYFGLPYDGGHVSTEYFDTMMGLQSLTDDVIFFSHLLCKDLASHGNKVLEKYKSQFKGELEHIHAIELSSEKTAGLIPKNEQYSDWLSGFQEREQGADA
jgi:hypothetical protein